MQFAVEAVEDPAGAVDGPGVSEGFVAGFDRGEIVVGEDALRHRERASATSGGVFRRVHRARRRARTEALRGLIEYPCGTLPVSTMRDKPDTAAPLGRMTREAFLVVSRLSLAMETPLSEGEGVEGLACVSFGFVGYCLQMTKRSSGRV